MLTIPSTVVYHLERSIFIYVTIEHLAEERESTPCRDLAGTSTVLLSRGSLLWLQITAKLLMRVLVGNFKGWGLWLISMQCFFTWAQVTSRHQRMHQLWQYTQQCQHQTTVHVRRSVPPNIAWDCPPPGRVLAYPKEAL